MDGVGVKLAVPDVVSVGLAVADDDAVADAVALTDAVIETLALGDGLGLGLGDGDGQTAVSKLNLRQTAYGALQAIQTVTWAVAQQCRQCFLLQELERLLTRRQLVRRVPPCRSDGTHQGRRRRATAKHIQELWKWTESAYCRHTRSGCQWWR